MSRTDLTMPRAPRARRASALPADERRSMIVAATLPLLLQNGEMVTTRQIAAAAGIAEGTIFRVFADKEALIAAVVDTALDLGPLERALATLDPALSFDDSVIAVIEILQQRVIDIWRLASSVGARFHERVRQQPIADVDSLVRLFERHRDRLSVEPMVAARLLRALTLATTHPMMAGEPMPATEIVALFLHGAGGRGASC